jgi:hypothetical protein
MDNMQTADRDVLLKVLAQYTLMKRQYASQERTVNSKEKESPAR